MVSSAFPYLISSSNNSKEYTGKLSSYSWNPEDSYSVFNSNPPLIKISTNMGNAITTSISITILHVLLDPLVKNRESADALQDEGRYDKAQELYNGVLLCQIKSLGPDHPERLATKNNLAITLQNLGKYNEAEELYNDVLERKIRTLGPKHLNTLRTEHNIAVLFENQNKYNDAQGLFKEVLQEQIMFLGQDHEDTYLTKNNLAILFEKQRQFNDAQELYNEVLQAQI
ncbi:unnamed protein product, partial [Allacma fusca]